MRDDKLARLPHRFATTATAHHPALKEMNEEGGAFTKLYTS